MDRELRIVVVDYGAGNLRSVSRALAHAGVAPLVTEAPAALAEADGVVLPGVGAAGSAMKGLAARGLIDPLRKYVSSGRPLLGVCLGLQVLLSGSDEDGGVECLGIIPGQVVRLPDGLKAPHIGWNQVEQARQHPIFAKIPDGANFYFVHSYYAVPERPESVIGTTEYGVSFGSVLARDNVVATQFHPEKSARDGLQVYQNFVDWVRVSTRSVDAVAVPGVEI